MRLTPLVFGSATLVSTGLGGVAALRFRDRMHLLLGFSSGAVIAVVLFDILPEAFSVDPHGSHMWLAGAGFLALFALERYTAMHRPREHMHGAASDEQHEQEMGDLGAAGLTLHSFLDGVAIGAGFQRSNELGLLIALGVIAHDLSDGLNTVTVVLAHGIPVGRARVWLALDMVAPLIGAAATLFVPLEGVMPWVLAFFAGSLLYIGASDLLPEAREHESPMVGIATMAGMLAIYLTTVLLRRI